MPNDWKIGAKHETNRWNRLPVLFACADAGVGADMTRYYVTGWSNRFSCWMCETFEAKSMEAAKQRFNAQYPGLKKIKSYALMN